MEKVTELENLVTSFKEDYEKFVEKGNKTAGTRARKTLQEIRNLAKDTRDEISSTKRQMVKA
jgi:vacuolar-type H+-ATPase subunit H